MAAPSEVSHATAEQQQEQQQRRVGAWALGAHIGAGSFAIVWRARHVETGAEAAVKEINLSKLNAKLRQSLESEVAILQRIRHGNIVQLHEVVEVRGAVGGQCGWADGGDGWSSFSLAAAGGGALHASRRRRSGAATSDAFATRTALQEKDRLYLVMEFCAGGDLAHFLRHVKRVPEATARHFMTQLAAGLRQMWSHHLVHVSAELMLWTVVLY